MRKPRSQHYIFAHKILPSLFHADPVKFITALSSHRNDLLHLLWAHAGTNMEESDLVAADNLDYEIRKLDEGTIIVLITLPTPQAVAEAYFVAMIYRSWKKEIFCTQEAVTRFITLEYSFNLLNDLPGTVLGEWTVDGTHINFGTGPEPILEDFFETVWGLMTE
ncbi:MAG TPA: hypothetical protein VNM22_09365 [Candidatus Limnocylindrales bacterium]|nr:hypothetical protein [Candidatus Limnocylindrales bacterium]